MTEHLRSEQFMKQALDTWSGAVYRLALSQTHCAADAQDITQDVFLKLLKSTVAFESDEHKKAWLLHVAANRCRELHRSAWKRRTELTDSLDTLADLAVSDPELEDLFEHPVWTELSRLPEKLRIVVHLHYIEGYSTEAVASILDILPSTVRVRLNRARKKLREALEQQQQFATRLKGEHHEAESL